MPDDAFSALGNARRREILDLLRRQPGLNAREVASAFGDVSEPAIARHLRVLREARLVRTHRQGREAHYRVDPSPLATIYTDYLRLFLPLTDQSLDNLRHVIEGSDDTGE